MLIKYKTNKKGSRAVAFASPVGFFWWGLMWWLEFAELFEDMGHCPIDRFDEFVMSLLTPDVGKLDVDATFGLIGDDDFSIRDQVPKLASHPRIYNDDGSEAVEIECINRSSTMCSEIDTMFFHAFECDGMHTFTFESA